MTKQLVHIPEADMDSLQHTAATMGGLEIEQVITAAVWAFSQEDVAFRNFYVQEFWFRGLDEPRVLKPGRSLKEKLHAAAHHLYATVRQLVVK